MNCKQANTIPLEKVFESFSLFPSKKSKSGAFYYALNRKERTPSLHLNYERNIAYDFGSGKSYDAVSLVQALKNCSVSEALAYLSQFSFSFPKQNFVAVKRKKGSTVKIRKVKTVEHPALTGYLKSRGVYKQKRKVKEIHYTLDDQFYFAIGFKNNAGGWEVRNKYAKLCLGRKAVSTINNNCKTLRIFEGFFDYLSFLTIKRSLKKSNSDYLILNSLSLSNRIKAQLKPYSKIELYLDNDTPGNQATESIRNWQVNIEDNRFLYYGFKDLNDWVKDQINL